MKNARRLSAEYGDMLSSLQEKIDGFVTSVAIPISGSSYPIPTNLYQAINLQYFDAIAEKVSSARALLLGASNMTPPSTLYPTYTEANGEYTMNPVSLTEDLVVNYIRIPEEPIFNPSASLGYQDFELPAEDAPKLVLEILKLAGVTIRDAEVVQAATGLDTAQYQKENS
jgi:hypothetical protein